MSEKKGKNFPFTVGINFKSKANYIVKSILIGIQTAQRVKVNCCGAEAPAAKRFLVGIKAQRNVTPETF